MYLNKFYLKKCPYFCNDRQLNMWGIMVEIILKMYYSLCRAVMYGMEMVYFFWGCQFDTPILASFRTHRHNAFIINLIRRGYNVNTRNKLGETPLHIAVSRPAWIEIAHELINAGADINAQDKSKRTPLRHAIQYENTEAVCMLLYYEADVNIVCTQGMTPFTYSLYSFTLNITRILTDYYNYDDFSNQPCYRVTSLHLAVAHDSDLAIHLLQNGADVNSLTRGGHSLLEFSLHYESGELFKLILSKMDHTVLLKRSGSFLLKYVNECLFVSKDWLDGMYLLLESPVAFELVQSCNDWLGLTFFKRLVSAFRSKQIKLNDRIVIIYTCLSMGARANIYDIIAMHISYGFSQEVEALVDVTAVTDCDGAPLVLPEGCSVTMPAFILALEPDLSTDGMYTALMNFLRDHSELDPSIRLSQQTSFVYFMELFSMPADVRKQFMDWCQSKTLPEKLLQKFDRMQSRTPEFPTLLELSRHQTRRFIKQVYQVQYPYQFHKAVRNLNAPRVIKDIIRLKRPIYY